MIIYPLQYEVQKIIPEWLSNDKRIIDEEYKTYRRKEI